MKSIKYKDVIGMRKTANGGDYSVVKPDAVSMQKQPWYKRVWDGAKKFDEVGGAFIDALPTAAKDAITGAARGMISIPAVAAQSIAQTPFAIQRAYDIGKEHFMHADGGKYAGIDGVKNKWNASSGIHQAGYWHAYADTANTWRQNYWDKWMDKVLPYSEQMTPEARALAEGGGALLGGAVMATGPAVQSNRFTQAAEAFNRLPKTPTDVVNLITDKVVGTAANIPRVGKYVRPTYTAVRQAYALTDSAVNAGTEEPMLFTPEEQNAGG